jgi:hypothetical protein
MKRCAILIPSLESRVGSWHNLLELLTTQIQALNVSNQFEIISNIDLGIKSIGKKRNELIHQAVRDGFDYIVFFDDDDYPGAKYIETLKNGMDNNVDVVSLRGWYWVDDNLDGVFEHSLKYKSYETKSINDINNDVKYERYPNHLNCMKLSIAKQFPFPEINHGEDTNFATRIFKSGLLKTEHHCEHIIYHYKFKSNK